MSRSVDASSTFTRDYTVNVYNTKASIERPIATQYLPARVIKNTPQEHDAVGLYIGKYNIEFYTQNEQR